MLPTALHDVRGVHVNHQCACGNALLVSVIREMLKDAAEAGARNAFDQKLNAEAPLELCQGRRHGAQNLSGLRFFLQRDQEIAHMLSHLRGLLKLCALGDDVGESGHRRVMHHAAKTHFLVKERFVVLFRRHADGVMVGEEGLDQTRPGLSPRPARPAAWVSN